MTNNPHLALRRQWLDDKADKLTTLSFNDYKKATPLRGVYKSMFRTVEGFEDAAGNETPMYVLANGMLSERPEPYAQKGGDVTLGEIAAWAAVVIAIFTFTMLLQAAGF